MKSRNKELWTNKYFLLGKSAVEIPPRKGPVISFEQSTQFLFGDKTFFLSFGDSIAQVLSMISVLLSEQLDALQNKANQKPVVSKQARELSAFHSFYPSISLPGTLPGTTLPGASPGLVAPVPKPLSSQV